jgi:hypothetical protein
MLPALIAGQSFPPFSGGLSLVQRFRGILTDNERPDADHADHPAQNFNLASEEVR